MAGPPGVPDADDPQGPVGEAYPPGPPRTDDQAFHTPAQDNGLPATSSMPSGTDAPAALHPLLQKLNDQLAPFIGPSDLDRRPPWDIARRFSSDGLDEAALAANPPTPADYDAFFNGAPGGRALAGAVRGALRGNWSQADSISPTLSTVLSRHYLPYSLLNQAIVRTAANNQPLATARSVANTEGVPPPGSDQKPTTLDTAHYLAGRALDGFLSGGDALARQAQLETGQLDDFERDQNQNSAALANQYFFGRPDLGAPAGPVQRYVGDFLAGAASNPVLTAAAPLSSLRGSLGATFASDLNEATGGYLPDWFVRLVGGGVATSAPGVVRSVPASASAPTAKANLEQIGEGAEKQSIPADTSIPSATEGVGAGPAVTGLIAKRPLQKLEVVPYKESIARGSTGRGVAWDGLTGDHIPSIAAIKRNVENTLGRELTDEESDALQMNTYTVVIGDDLHAAGRTFGLRNTPAQIAEDAPDLNAAGLKDQHAHLQNASKYGYEETELQGAFDVLNQHNKALFSRLSTSIGIKTFFKELGVRGPQ